MMIQSIEKLVSFLYVLAQKIAVVGLLENVVTSSPIKYEESKKMVDQTRKGHIQYCETCQIKTRHVADAEPSEKLIWWVCEKCGHTNLYDNWCG